MGLFTKRVSPNRLLGWLARCIGAQMVVCGVCLVANLATGLGVAAAPRPSLELVGLFRDTAVVRIDGRQRLLKVGVTSPEGVRLVSASLDGAVISFDGERQRLKLSQKVSGSYQKVLAPRVTIPADSYGQYRVRGSINGNFLSCLVDTGASVIAMSSMQAERLGLDYLGGDVGLVETANGEAKSYFLTLDKVTIGGITQYNVRAAVVDGLYPAEVLLGMSFLGQLTLHEKNGVMNLVQDN